MHAVPGESDKRRSAKAGGHARFVLIRLQRLRAASHAPSLIGLLKRWYRSPTTMSTFCLFTRSAKSDLTSLTVGTI
jgi:hypothetical protein